MDTILNNTSTSVQSFLEIKCLCVTYTFTIRVENITSSAKWDVPFSLSVNSKENIYLVISSVQNVTNGSGVIGD